MGTDLQGKKEAAAGETPSASSARDAMTVVRDFIHSLGQAVKTVSLYSVAHPVSVSAMQGCRRALAELFARMQWRQAVFTLVGGRWIVNGMVVGEARLSESLSAVFQGRPFDVVCFLAGVQPYEIEAFCELAGLPANRLGEVDPAQFLGRKDVSRIQLQGVRIPQSTMEEAPVQAAELPPVRPRPLTLPAATRARTEPPAPVTKKPADAARPPATERPRALPGGGAPAPELRAAPRPGPAPASAKETAAPVRPAAAAAGSSSAPERKPSSAPVSDGPAKESVSIANFGVMLKSLVEEAVSDPEERVRVYSEAVAAIKGALEHRVAERTRKLEEEARRVQDERVRTEEVLSTLAAGKVVVDKDGRVLMMDPAAERIVGKRLVDIAGKPIVESVDASAGMVSLARSIGAPSSSEEARRLDVVGVDEVASAFRNSMALLQNDEGRVVGTYGVLPAMAKFKETARLQEDFISQVTHELKAPLASMRSALELVEQLASAKLGSQEKRFLEISRDNTLKLGRMIDEMLDFSKMQAGKFVLKPEPVDVASLVREAAEGLRPWADSRKLKLDVSTAALGEGEILVLADRVRVVQILTNLLSNAIKSTPEGGAIRVAAEPGGEEHPGQVVLSVKDTGCGVAPEDQERIFQKFVQAVPKGQRREGVGLGLTIVQELVARHKGVLWLQSEVGHGATFSFTLPLVVHAPAVEINYERFNPARAQEE